MKYFCYLFSCYFLLLSLIPCSDIHEVNTSGSTIIANISTDEHSNCPHETEQDFCSPFCTCNCCGQLFTEAKFVKFASFALIMRFLKEKSTFTYLENWSNYDFKDFFQPPQVA
jgi:hypothetical protein